MFRNYTGLSVTTRIYICYLSRKPDIIATMSSLKFAIPSLTELRTIVEEKFNIRPCIFQAHAALVQLEQKDCVTISPTGSGKTLRFSRKVISELGISDVHWYSEVIL